MSIICICMTLFSALILVFQLLALLNPHSVSVTLVYVYWQYYCQFLFLGVGLWILQDTCPDLCPNFSE